MDKENSSPTIALHLGLQQGQSKAVQDVMEMLPINVEEAAAPIHITKDKLRIHTSAQANKSELKQQRMSEVKTHMMLTPSISVVLFMVDSDLEMSRSELCRQTFAQSAWKFHHLTEVNTTAQTTNRIHCKQEYYELMPDLPLFSLGTTHFGKQILRINIVTYNHSEMTEFYSKLLNQRGICVRSNFTYFTFQYSKDLTLQLALKRAPELMPYPIDSADLVLSLRNLPNNLQLDKVADNLYSVTDPDQNSLLIHSLPVELGSTAIESVTTCNPSDLVMTNCEPTELEKKSLSMNYLTRPDVIPSQDGYIASSHKKTIVTKIQSIGTRRRSGSPVIGRKKLEICNMSGLSGSQADLTEVNNNKGQYKRRHSIDVLETF